MSEASVHDQLAVLISVLWKGRMLGMYDVAKLLLMVVRNEREREEEATKGLREGIGKGEGG